MVLKCSWSTCDGVYKRPVDLYAHVCEEHINVPHNATWFCSWVGCDMRLDSGDALDCCVKAHLILHMKRYRPHACSVDDCEMRYALYVELRQHQVEAHPDVFSHVKWDDSEHLCTPPSTEDVQSSRPVAPFVESPQISQPATLDMVTTRCDWDGCVLRFRDPHELLQHLVKDHVPSATETAQKRFECAWGGCPKTTKTRGHLQGHVSVHVPTTFKPHICELCSKNCRNAGTLTGHMTNVHGFNENSLKPKTKTKTKKKKAPVHVDTKIVKEPAEDARLDVPMVQQPRVATHSKVAAPPLTSSSRPTGQAHGGVSAGALGGMAGRISKRKSSDRDEHGKTGRPAVKRLKFAYNDKFIRKEKKDGRS